MSKAHKSRKKKGDPEIDPKRKASLEAKIRKQVACEERAFRIVEKLLDNPITEEYLIDCAKFITPSHYADITIERSVAKQCGYPVCENGLSNMPKQKYHISTHSNKIYDISERKCFCSNFCYKASKYFENQVPSSPVWTREGEIPPDITLLSKDKTTKKDFKIEGAGQEVVLISPKVKKEDINQVTVNPDDVPEVPLDELADDLSQLLITDEEHMSQIKDRADEETRFENKSEMNEVGTSCHGNQSNAGGLSASDKVPSEETHEDLCMELQNKQRSVVEKEDTAADESQQQKVGVVDNLEQRTKDSVTVKPKTKKRKPKKCLDVPINKSLPLEIVRKTLFEWRTVEAIRLVFGDETANKLAATQQELVQTLQQQSSQPSANTEIVNNLSDSSVNAVAQQQTEQLAQQSVNMSEEDRAKNKSVAGMPGEKDYGQLLQQQKSNKLVAGEKKISREEAIFEAKVQKFYRGTVLSKKEDVKREEKDVVESQDTRQIILPFVDSQSQLSIRRNIVMQKLNRAYQSLLGPLRLSMKDISTSLNTLVKSFHLSSTNVVLRPAELTLMAVVLLLMLSKMDSHLQDHLSTAAVTTYLSTILQQVGTNMDDVMLILTSLQY